MGGRGGRVKAAAGLLASGAADGDAAIVLAQRFGISLRQARRYVEQAAATGPTAVPETTTVFTVKLPATLVARVRERARETGTTISALVAQALTEFLAGATESAHAGERPGGRDRVRLRPPRGHGSVGGLRHSRASAAGPDRVRSGRTVAP